MSTPARPARRRATATAGLLLVAGLTVAGCGAGGGAGDSGAASGASVSDEMAPQSGRGVVQGGAVAPDAATADGSKEAPAAGTGTPTVDFAASAQKLARRANIALTVDDVDVAAAKVRAVAASEKGLVLAESISSEPDDVATGGFSTITISVPTTRLDAALDRTAEIGKVHSRNTSTDDVTAQYVDTASRVETMESSVERVRALMSKATRLADIVSLESELSRRQADLEAVKSQLAALDGQVSMAPIEVRLSTDEKVLEVTEPDTGFLAGLAAGWDAFTGSVTVLLTVLGALLPFAFALALVLVPLVVWMRRRGPRPSTVTPPMAPAPPVA
ncbi:DUF4349 domain-containing protein [Oryzobacter telluris]|uniref:DUF4349 domain-containing protein n=1 Tax=Oryzobacter telluris TaxID=3149179 RepID=UPI00370D6F40